eukprot:1126235-Amphidinium_carterae.1
MTGACKTTLRHEPIHACIFTVFANHGHPDSTRKLGCVDRGTRNMVWDDVGLMYLSAGHHCVRCILDMSTKTLNEIR